MAKHVLRLSDVECAAVEAALLAREESLLELQQVAESQAQLVERSAERHTWEIAADPHARYAIEKRCWDEVSSQVGYSCARQLARKPDVRDPMHVRRDILVKQGNEFIREAFVEFKGRQFNPKRGMTLLEGLSPELREVVERDLEEHNPLSEAIK